MIHKDETITNLQKAPVPAKSADTGARSLSPDDIEALCAVDCTPLHLVEIV